MSDGWLKIYRKMTEWEWYTNSEMVHLFLHLLIKAATCEKTWRGVKLQRGQAIVGRQKLSAETGISEMKIRTCMTRLQLSGEITIKSSNRFTVVTICKYDDYQPKESELIQPINQLDSQQNNQPVNHNKEDKNIISLSPYVDKESVKKKPKKLSSKKEEEPEPPHEPGVSRTLKNGEQVSLVTRGQEIFMAYFQELYDEQYQWKAKDSVAMKRLLKTIENSRKAKKVPLPTDDDSLIFALDKFIRSIKRDWLLDNFTVTVIDSQYNNIIAQIKNSRKNGTNNTTNPQSSNGAAIIERQRAACVDDIAKADELYFKQMRQQGSGGASPEPHPVDDNQ